MRQPNARLRPLPQAYVYARKSKFGRVLVLETSERSGGGFILGFRVDPPDAMENLLKEMAALIAAALASPNFGVAVATAEDERRAAGGSAASASAATIRASDDVEIVDDGSGGGGGDAFAAYFADGSKESDRDVIFSDELGLAIERPPEGLTLARLWAPL